MTDIKKGDRVKVTIEGVVRAANEVFVSVNDDEGKWLGEVNYLKNSVEKIELPVEVFKPGDRLRRKVGAPGDLWNIPFEVTLGANGYIHHGANDTFSKYQTANALETFTSKKYEKVHP